MKIINVKNYEGIKEKLGEYPNSSACKYYYRGLRYDYSLLPSIYYEDVSKILASPQIIRKYEANLLNGFYHVLKERYNLTPFNINDWNLWFIARHFGLKSRLIDFSKEITVALQFAFEMSNKCPARLYCLNSDSVKHLIQNDFNETPFSLNMPSFIQPSLQHKNIIENLGTSRPFIQSSIFFYQNIETLQTPLTEQYNEIEWLVFEIRAEDFEKIKKEISLETGYCMNKPLLIRNHSLDENCSLLNKSCLSNLVTHYI